MIEQFSRGEFEKALSFAPLGYKLLGAESGQLEYKISMATQKICECGNILLCGVDQNCCLACGKQVKWQDGSLRLEELFIKVYSSISPHTGLTNQETGADSIRLILCYKNGQPVGKIGHYITRTKGWQERMKNRARELWALALRLPRCECGLKAKICRSTKAPNKDREFYLCPRCQFKNWIGWVEEA